MVSKKTLDVIVVKEIPGEVVVPSMEEVKKKMNKAFFGNLYFWTETGTEGGYWTLKTGSSYEDLHVLETGDYLEIYKPTGLFRKKLVWRGIIDLEYYASFTHGIFGYWIHSSQKGVNMEEWASYFFEGLPAKLIPDFYGNN